MAWLSAAINPGVRMADVPELHNNPQYQATVERLKAIMRVAPSGVDYWVARDINVALGYPTWREFEAVIERAVKACEGTGIEPAKHFVLTHKMVEIGSGAKRRQDDYFLS